MEGGNQDHRAHWWQQIASGAAAAIDKQQRVRLPTGAAHSGELKVTDRRLFTFQTTFSFLIIRLARVGWRSGLVLLGWLAARLILYDNGPAGLLVAFGRRRHNKWPRSTRRPPPALLPTIYHGSPRRGTGEQNWRKRKRRNECEYAIAKPYLGFLEHALIILKLVRSTGELSLLLVAVTGELPDRKNPCPPTDPGTGLAAPYCCPVMSPPHFRQHRCCIRFQLLRPSSVRRMELRNRRGGLPRHNGENPRNFTIYSVIRRFICLSSPFFDPVGPIRTRTYIYIIFYSPNICIHCFIHFRCQAMSISQ